jgi:threonine dehydratase
MKDLSVTTIPDFDAISAAHRRIKRVIRETPVINDYGMDRLLGCQLFFKCENLQRTGAFKFRGASNAVACLDERELPGDVATHSSGNHGAALALAASTAGRTAHVVMPENSVASKVASVRRNGGKVHFCAPTQPAREAGLETLVNRGCIPVHPYDDADIIAGQGTAALEWLGSGFEPDIIMTPVGGGGLISGTALATHHLRPATAVYGAEPSSADDTARSLARGQRLEQAESNTIADGLRALIGVLNFNIVSDHVERVLTVTDDDIITGMAIAWQNLRMLIEPSSATVIAAIRRYPDVFAGKRVGVIISGGNLDPRSLPFDPDANID